MKTILVAKALIFNEKNELLLLLRGETAPRRPLQWDLPGGLVEDDEHLHEAVVRETQEETALKISPKNVKLIYSVTHLGLHGSALQLFYSVKVSKPVVKISWEHNKFKWATLDQATELIEYEVQLNALKYIIDNKVEI